MADLLPNEAFVLGRATLNIAVGSMQIVGYGLGGLLLMALSPRASSSSPRRPAPAGGGAVPPGSPTGAARASGPVVRRTREVNRLLLGSRVLRPLYVSSWVPNGLIVGCEALFIPYAGEQAGYLLAATAAGMLAGDVVVGRFLGHDVATGWSTRCASCSPPFLLFWFDPHLGRDGAGTGRRDRVRHSLPLQERLVVAHTPAERGQVLGLRATGLGRARPSARCWPAPPPTCWASAPRPPARRWR